MRSLHTDFHSGLVVHSPTASAEESPPPQLPQRLLLPDFLTMALLSGEAWYLSVAFIHISLNATDVKLFLHIIQESPGPVTSMGLTKAYPWPPCHTTCESTQRPVSVPQLGTGSELHTGVDVTSADVSLAKLVTWHNLTSEMGRKYVYFSCPETNVGIREQVRKGPQRSPCTRLCTSLAEMTQAELPSSLPVSLFLWTLRSTLHLKIFFHQIFFHFSLIKKL